ncbi:MAG: heme-binding domain-containing protein [Acidobacteriota bacterium]
MLPRLAVFAAVALVGLQFLPLDRSNPPVTAEIPASAAVNSVIRRACYDCHSNETMWPWYSRVAPVSFLVARDVHEGRRHLNFSTWGQYEPAKQAKLVREIWKQVSTGEMPMSIYLPLHPHARLSAQDKAVFEAWAKTVDPNISARPATAH